MEDGVWRTIAGRKVFIKDGQSLSDAMKNSGKFEKKEDVKAKIKKQFDEKNEKELYKNVVQGKVIEDEELMDVNEIIKRQGFDGKPIVIKDEKEFEKMVKNDTAGMYRGIRGETKEQVAKYKKMLREGEFITNSDNESVSGRGLYTAAYSPNDINGQNASRELAEKYAGFRSMFSKPGTEVEYKDTGQVERFTFTKDVKIYKPSESEKMLKDYQIAKKGYDAYYNRNGDYIIILNRTKMIILDK